MVSAHDVDKSFFLLGDPGALALAVRDVLRSRTCFADQVEHPERLKGRDGEAVYVCHDGYLRPAWVSMNEVEPSVGASWEDAADWTYHVKVFPGWGSAAEAFLEELARFSTAPRP